MLKIDRSFVQDVGGASAQTEALTASILDLAGILSLKTVAEGIEDDRQLQRLRELGCERGQGYHLHRPLAAADLEALLLRRRAVAAGACPRPAGQRYVPDRARSLNP